VAEVKIRAAAAADADAVAAMWESLVEYHVALDDGLPPAAPNGARRYARRLLERAADPLTQVLIAEVDGIAAGYVLGVVVDLVPEMFEQEASGFLADIFVVEAFRRAGVGEALVEALGAWFKARGIRYFEWHVAARNAAGLAFWQAMGGREVMIRMRKDLT
jgi:GNAT superfamily N-acetyltransferase